ncbi:MAG: hypothetical protein KY455_03280 [Euryarchaeota archaeon]|nr:hypothetical protein [Euryarchaeota archaeon]
MLMITLLWSLIMPRPHPAGMAARPSRPPRRAKEARFAPGGGTVTLQAPSPPRWLGSVATAAREEGLGRVETVGPPGERSRLNITGCRSCRDAAPAEGCTFERDVIGRAVVRTEPEATVVEVSCRAHGGHECLFEVRLEADA